MGTSLAVQCQDFIFQRRWYGFNPLLGELRPQMPHGQENQNIEQKQYCNRFNKNFKMVHIKKMILKIIKLKNRRNEEGDQRKLDSPVINYLVVF